MVKNKPLPDVVPIIKILERSKEIANPTLIASIIALLKAAYLTKKGMR